MKKNRLFIVGLAGMMTAALILSGCDPGEKDNNDPKKIIITGIPKEAKNGAGAIYLASSKSSNGIVAGGTGVVSNGSAEAYLYKINGNAASVDRWTGTGSYYVVIAGEENNDEDRVFISKTKIEINNATTIIPFSSFEEVEDLESLIDGGKLPNNPSKKIVITGIPDEVTGTGQVTLASSLSEAGIVAMGQGTISGGTAEADLYKFVNGSPSTTEKWTGTGLYYVVIGGEDKNGDSKIFVSKDKIDISSATTTVSFDSFEEMDGGDDDALIEDSGSSPSPEISGGGGASNAPKKIVITGIPDEATGNRQVTLASSLSEAGIVAMGKGTISGGTAEADLYTVDINEEGLSTTEKWTGTGLYYVVIGGKDENGDSKTFVSKDKIDISNATTIIPFSSFEEMDGGGGDSPAEDSGSSSPSPEISGGGGGGASAEQPKQIVITGIPDEATGIRQVTLAGNPFGTGIVAKGTISAGTAELYMVVGETLTVERWTGTGLYYVVIAVAGDSKTFVSKDKIEIKDATTTILFSFFEKIMEAKDAEADGGGE